MAAIVATSMQGPGPRAVTETTCTNNDTLTYEAGDILILRNPTAGSLTPTLTGAGATTYPVERIGTISTAAGVTLGAIAAGAARAVALDTIGAYLVGALTLTGSTGLVASILRR